MKTLLQIFEKELINEPNIIEEIMQTETQQHTEESLAGLTWGELYFVASDLANKITKAELHGKLLVAFPLKTGQQYIGSLANHFRGRLKNDGVEDLIDRMDKCSLRCLIIGLSKGIS